MKIVLLPGLDGTGVLFKPFIDLLPANIEPLVISYPLNRQLSYDELIEIVLTQLPEEKFILVAESFSGYIAYKIALYKPVHLQFVVFVATFLENPRPFLLSLSYCLPRRWILSATLPNYIIKSFLFGSAVNNNNKKMIDLFNFSIKQVLPQVLCSR